MSATTAYQTVLRAETEHLKRNMRANPRSVQPVFVTTQVVIALGAFGWCVVNTIPQQPSFLYWLATTLNLDTSNFGVVSQLLEPFTLLFPIGVLIWELWLLFQTLVMSTNSIARERNGNSWELLLLTGATTSQIIRAKWRAVVQHQWRNYAFLAIMRIGALSFLALNFSVNFRFGIFPSFSYGSQGSSNEPERTTVFVIAVAIVLISAALIAMLTMLNLMFTAACGIVGGVVARRAALALPAGIGIRIGSVVVLALLAGVPAYVVLKPNIEGQSYAYSLVASTSFLILGLIATALIDQGGIAAGLLVRFGYNVRWRISYLYYPFFSSVLRGHGKAFLTALLLSCVIYATLTFLLLWWAEKTIARQNSE